jgi:hypothetical protein
MDAEAARYAAGKSAATSETGSVPRRETHNYASMTVGPKLRLDLLLWT